MPRLYCEIKCCEICNEWIESTNKLVIIKNKHYHKDCVILCRLSSHILKPVPCLTPSAPSLHPSVHS